MRKPWTAGIAGRVAGSLAFRACCYAVMMWLALWAEARPAPHLPDLVLDVVPYVPWIDRINYFLWLAAYVPMAVWLAWADVERFIRYTVSSGVLALLRGLSILVTGLGPVQGDDVHAGLDAEARWRAFLHLATPFGFFDSGSGARVYLTKDLFFSGHVATTALLLLYVWKWPRARAVMLVAHLVVVASVFLSHLHYTIDVLGAYAVTLAFFAWRERGLQAALSGEHLTRMG